MSEPNQMALMPAQNQPTSMLAVIDRAARDPAINVDKMERLLALAEAIHAREAKAAYDQAMNDAQAEMRPISRDCHNPQTRSRYASYETIDSAIRPIYTAHGFSMSFGSKASSNPDRVIVTCRVSHRGGHTEPVELEMPADGKGAKGGDVMTKTHATGSALSYGKRYIANLVWNLSFGEADDDGNAAGGKRGPETTPLRNATGLPAEPQTRPAATTASVTPKAPTEKTRAWFVKEVAERGLTEYAEKMLRGLGWLGADQPITELDLQHVPNSKPALNEFLAQAEKLAVSSNPPIVEEDGLPESIAKVVIHIPPAGTNKADYKDKDTIGSLYGRIKAGDGDARTRLWGFVSQYEPTGYNGQPPTKEDLALRDGLDAFERWHDEMKLKRETGK